MCNDNAKANTIILIMHVKSINVFQTNLSKLPLYLDFKVNII